MKTSSVFCGLKSHNTTEILLTWRKAVRNIHLDKDEDQNHRKQPNKTFPPPFMTLKRQLIKKYWASFVVCVFTEFPPVWLSVHSRTKLNSLNNTWIMGVKFQSHTAWKDLLTHRKNHRGMVGNSALAYWQQVRLEQINTWGKLKKYEACGFLFNDWLKIVLTY